MRKAVCLNRACQPPAPVRSNLLVGPVPPRLRWRKEAAILHLSSLQKAPKKRPFTATACGFPAPELTFYSADYTCCEWLICKIDTFATDFINLWLEP